ncbi:metal-dependent phosphohydrolase [Methylobacterium thuringiense]|uniref:HD domain-containing protein n=1 Tax=Methylobacterium thuringiense TaxID=1003091 RepID=A0ABQ4TMI2_9HYPH|nr:metal-dependent phosphohydrolase [Methylobacterium thuringiense]GJE55245.1 hypothetical protein EKPJFOCH_1734 [Methylobacterium thuringiense]
MTRTILPRLRRTAADAEAFARVVHADQVDKAGRPYVEHLSRVAKSACRKALERGFALHSPELDELLQTAWLHDVIEDRGHCVQSLMMEGFSREVGVAVFTLSRFPGEPYDAFIHRVVSPRTVDFPAAGTLTVLIVKLADMEDNADPERLALLPDDVRARLERKYGEPLEMLRAAVERGAGRDG